MKPELLYSIGNKKIGKDTIIINLHTATNCPAKDACLVRTRCYAHSNERLRPTVYAFRKRQEALWETMPAEFFIEELKDIKCKKLKYIRFQEAGDFAGQHDLNKLSYIASELAGYYSCYTYTSRHDLDYSYKSHNLVITGSYFMVDNMYLPMDSDAYKLIVSDGEKPIVCPNNCRNCTLCKIASGCTIYQKKH